MTLYLDCSQTLVYGMFDLKGPTPIPLMQHAVRKWAAEHPDDEIVVWTFGANNDAYKVSQLCFPELTTTARGKDYLAPQAGDIVVDDDDAYWSEMEDITFYYPDDFTAAVLA